MRPLTYSRAVDVQDAIALATANPASAFLAGGTTEVDLIRAGISHSEHLVDVNELPLRGVEDLPDGGLHIGALARMSDVARTPSVVERYPAISRALLLGASEQLRNMASLGGNLRQRTRCAYLRDGVSPCNKREPGSGCAALDGFNRGHAILGTSEHCIATNPSDQNVALMALDAVIHIEGVKGSRAVPIAEFYVVPGSMPERETVLEPGDLITYVTLPKLSVGAKSCYLKLRDRASYEFALASAAVVMKHDGSRIEFIRIAMGGVGTKPWRSMDAEKALTGKAPTVANFHAAAEAALRGAKPQSQNGFKVELAKRCLVHAMNQVRQSA